MAVACSGIRGGTGADRPRGRRSGASLGASHMYMLGISSNVSTSELTTPPMMTMPRLDREPIRVRARAPAECCRDDREAGHDDRTEARVSALLDRFELAPARASRNVLA